MFEDITFTYTLGIVAVVCLFFDAIVIVKLYKAKALLHPGFSFSILFLLTIFSTLLVDFAGGNMSIVSPEITSEVFFFALISGFFLTLFAFWGRDRVVSNYPSLDVENFKNVFLVLSPTCFFFSITKFFRRGGSLNFQQMRRKMVELDTALYDTGHQSSFDSLIGYFELFNQVLMIYSGWELSLYFFDNKAFQEKWNKPVSRILLLLPIFTSFIFALSVGGRAVFILYTRLLVFGIILRISSLKEIKFSNLHRFFRIILVFFIIFSIYSNINLNQRYDAGGFVEQSVLKSVPVINNFYSVVDYLASTVYGYQLRRMDYVTQELDYGVKSFGGLLFTRLPLSNFLRIDTSLGEIIGLQRKYSMKQMFLELEESNALHFSLVATLFMTLYDDFGFYGCILVVFFLAILSQYIFIKWFSSNHKGFLSVYLLTLVFWFWSNAFFDPIFASGYANNFLFIVIVCDLLTHLF